MALTTQLAKEKTRNILLISWLGSSCWLYKKTRKLLFRPKNFEFNDKPCMQRFVLISGNIFINLICHSNNAFCKNATIIVALFFATLHLPSGCGGPWEASILAQPWRHNSTTASCQFAVVIISENRFLSPLQFPFFFAVYFFSSFLFRLPNAISQKSFTFIYHSHTDLFSDVSSSDAQKPQRHFSDFGFAGQNQRGFSQGRSRRRARKS